MEGRQPYIAAFYERAGYVRLRDGSKGSVTIGGTVSPAGGNFEEPVTQATLKVVGGFHGLTRERSDARKFPAIDPIGSWSKYKSVIREDWVAYARKVLYNDPQFLEGRQPGGCGISVSDAYAACKGYVRSVGKRSGL